MKKFFTFFLSCLMCTAAISCSSEKKSEQNKGQEASAVIQEPQVESAASSTAASAESQSSIQETSSPKDSVDNLQSNTLYKVASEGGLRLRDKPGLDGNKIGLVRDNQFVYVKEISPYSETIDSVTSRWVKINWNGNEGWIFGGYLTDNWTIPQDEFDENSYEYSGFKEAYGSLKATDISPDWKEIYIFSKDYIYEPQQMALAEYDMFTEVDFPDCKILTGLYRDKDSVTGRFIIKMDPAETKIIEKMVVEDLPPKILFLKPWQRGSENLTVGSRFYSEAGYYVVKENITYRNYFDFD